MSMQEAEGWRGSSLITAALTGLMGAGLVACGGKDKEKIIEVPTKSMTGVVTSTTVDKTITLTSFLAQCETRGGVVQTHASCAGANTCAGISFHSSSGKLSEHSCKAANICSGMSCVDLPADRGLTGAEILEGSNTASMGESEVQCNFCHGEGKTAFVLPIAPYADAAASTTAFQAKSDATLMVAIAFGIHGVNADGTAYANMPGFYLSYSLAEMKRLVTHLRSLPLETKNWRAAP